MTSEDSKTKRRRLASQISAHRDKRLELLHELIVTERTHTERSKRRTQWLARLNWQPQTLQACVHCDYHVSDVRFRPCECEIVCVQCMRSMVAASLNPECPVCKVAIEEFENF